MDTPLPFATVQHRFAVWRRHDGQVVLVHCIDDYWSGRIFSRDEYYPDDIEGALQVIDGILTAAEAEERNESPQEPSSPPT